MEKMLMESCRKAFALVPEDKRPDIKAFGTALGKSFNTDPTFGTWNDYYFFPGFDADIARYVYDEWQPKKKDVVIASYAKTGTTWTREIVRQILYRKDKALLEATNIKGPMFSYLETVPMEKFQVIDNFPMDRRVLGTHLPAPLFNSEKFRKTGSKVIYVYRNPKDQVVSWYNFVMGFPFIGKEPFLKKFPRNEKEFYDLAIAGKQHNMAKDGEGYLEHVRGWYKHRNDDNVLFICYEDMKADICGQLKKIGDFIGEDLTEDEINTVAEQTTFKKMKQEEIKNPGLSMMRKGQVGNWKDHLTVAQSELIDSKVDKILGHTNIKFRFEL